MIAKKDKFSREYNKKINQEAAKGGLVSCHSGKNAHSKPPRKSLDAQKKGDDEE